MAKTGIDFVRGDIAASRAAGKKWREIGEAYPDVKVGTLCRIAHDASYIPKSRRVLKALGLVRARKPDPVIRVKRLRRRIAALHFSLEIRREIEAGLLP